MGFRAPAAVPLAAELLQRVADEAADEASALYRDPTQPATATPAAVPAALQAFARAAVQRLVARPGEIERALGEVFSEPKPQVWFDAGRQRAARVGVDLAAATRMLYDEHHVFINGESFRAGGRDARLMRRLADERHLAGADCERLSAAARDLLDGWHRHGWLTSQPAASRKVPQ